MADFNTSSASFDAIKELAEASEAAVASVASSETITNNFSPIPEAVPTTKAKKPKTAKELEAEARKTKIAQSIRSAASGKRDSKKLQLIEAMSKLSRICAYVSAYGEKIDFATSTTSDKLKGEKIKNIVLKQSGPSAVQGVVIKVPKKIYSSIKDIDTLTDDDVQAIIAAEQTYTLISVSASELPSWMLNNTAAYLLEDDALFVPYRSKRVVVERPGDVPAPKGCSIGAHNGLYLRLNTREYDDLSKLDNKEAISKVFKVVHTCRGKLATPVNTVALKKYVTITPKPVYSEAEAKDLNMLYLSKYTKERKITDKQGTRVKPCTLLGVAPQTAALIDFTTDQGQVVITGSKFFPTSGDSFFNSATVDAWYDRNADGTPVKIAGSAIKLIAKEYKDSKDPNKARTAKTSTIELKAADASGEYLFTADNFKEIFEASQGMIDFDTVLQCKTATRRTSKSSADTNFTVDATEFVGADASDILNAIRAAL